MIDVKNMTKEQKQKAVLIGIVGLALIFALKQFAIGPLISHRGEARVEYEALKAKLDLAKLAIKNQTDTLKKLEVSKQALERASRDYIPSSDNLLAWATKTIYTQARTVGVDVESVSETDMDVSEFTAKEQAKRAFKPYGVRIAMQCNYAQLSHLVQALEESNPHLCVTNIQVYSQSATPEQHTVSIVVEWPCWKDPQRAKAFKSEEDKNA